MRERTDRSNENDDTNGGRTRKKQEEGEKEMARRGIKTAGMYVDNLGDRVMKRRNRSTSVHSGQLGVRPKAGKNTV